MIQKSAQMSKNKNMVKNMDKNMDKNKDKTNEKTFVKKLARPAQNVDNELSAENAQDFKATTEQQTFEFQIAGVPYRIKTHHDENTVIELVSFLNQKMEQALKATKYGSYQNAAVLTALNLAEELMLLKRNALKELDFVEEEIFKALKPEKNSTLTGMAEQASSNHESNLRSELAPEI